MTAIKKILNQDNEQILPVTSTSAVIDSNGTTLESRLQYLEGGETDPFKGWFTDLASLQSAHPSPKVGDYAYIPDASPATTASIYECTTAGTWSDSGRDVDTSNVQTFQTGEQLNAVGIDSTPTVNSTNLVTSGGVKTAIDQTGQTVAGIDEVTAAALNELDERINGILESLQRGLPYLRVEQLVVARKFDAYIAEGNFYLSGEGAPSVLPQFNGQEYFDTTNNTWYKAAFTGVAPTASAWKLITA